MTRFLRIAPILSGTIFMSGCLFGGDDSSGPSRRVESDVPYVQIGDAIIIKGDGRVDTLRYCGTGKNPVTELDTVRDDTSAIELSADSLSILNRPVALDTQATIQYISLYTRVKGGPGLTGTWRWRGYAYRVVSGTLSAAQQEAQEVHRGDILSTLSKYTYLVEFTGTDMISSTDERPADSFVEDWYSGTAPLYSDTAGFRISARALDSKTVQLKGLVSGEVLKVALSERNSDFKVTSSVSGHAAFEFMENPLSCPSAPEPSWYGDFLGDNPK
ncbi:MAG: hypothetical protein JWP91_847 [Fibrobacteres bacterium]|nr:hypothetical protein [Fibrobacterota bacterium]